MKKCGSRSDEKSVEPYQIKRVDLGQMKKVWNPIRKKSVDLGQMKKMLNPIR